LEIIFRKPISKKLLTPPTYAFIGLLIAFMLFVSYYDVKKLLPYSSKDETKTGVLSEQFAERVLKVEKALQEKENSKQG